MTVTPAYRYRARVIRVVDGDTYELAIDLGFRVEARIMARLRGVDTPEMDTAAGRAARADVLARLSEANSLVVESYRDRQSFARWVVDVWVDGESLSAWILAQGLGAPA